MTLKEGKSGKLLHSAFETTGVHGMMDMAKDEMPDGLVKGSLGHILLLTLSASIDYQRDANSLWQSSMRTYEDPETRYLLNPRLLQKTSPGKIAEDMLKYKLAKKPRKDPIIWRTVGVTFCKK